jgi:hypothetical protein
VIGTVPHRAEFRELRIDVAFLFFKANKGCVNDRVRKPWNGHFCCSPTYILPRFCFARD